MDILLKTNDRFVEKFYTDRWYNIFEIHDRDDDRIKCWYYNIGKPAIMETENQLSYVDLALDLWISAEGKQTVLDEDEFFTLEFDENTRQKALMALHELQNQFSEKWNPSLK